MELYQFAKELITDAGDFIETRRLDGFEVERKTGPSDLVTPVDKETETFIYKRIKTQFPEHKIIGEEEYGKDLEDTSGIVWVVDPIDGTVNFINQNDNFAISIGIYKDDEPLYGFVYDVNHKVLYHAKVGEGAYRNTEELKPIEKQKLDETIVGFSHKWLIAEEIGPSFREVMKQARSVRNRGSAALDFTSLIEGKYGAGLFYTLFPWDYSGGMIIGNEVGLKTTDLLGRELPHLQPSSVLAGHPDLVDEISEIFNNEAFIKAHDEYYKKEQ